LDLAELRRDFSLPAGRIGPFPENVRVSGAEFQSEKLNPFVAFQGKSVRCNSRLQGYHEADLQY